MPLYSYLGNLWMGFPNCFQSTTMLVRITLSLLYTCIHGGFSASTISFQQTQTVRLKLMEFALLSKC